MKGVTLKVLGALAVFVIVLIGAPYVVNAYVLSILTTVLFLSFIGQAWNLMLGFAGLLSLGHALFVGVGAYAAAAVFVHLGIGPWLGIFVAIACAVAAGCLIGYLGFRFSISGVYFALLTIAFAEFTRIVVDHLDWLGATQGLFLPVSNRTTNDLLNLRGTPEMFYYVVLALSLSAFALCHWLLGSRLGFYWRAIRDDAAAAEASGVDIFRCRMAAVAISSAMSGIAGTWYAFYYNNLFPEITFNIVQSIEITLGPIVGGVGTLFGPILGAFVLTPLGEVITHLTEPLGLHGAKQFFWGLAVALIVLLRPQGLWPWIAGLLGLGRKS
jgi:branched-chain amino acid transport system permease protein